MTFEFRKKNWAVVDAERNIILYSIGSYYGRDGERGGGQRFELELPEGRVYAHLFIDERFPTPNTVTLDWEPYTIECEESLRGKETYILQIFQEALQHYPETFAPEHIEKITTHFQGWESKIRFKESIPSQVVSFRKIEKIALCNHSHP